MIDEQEASESQPHPKDVHSSQSVEDLHKRAQKSFCNQDKYEKLKPLDFDDVLSIAQRLSRLLIKRGSLSLTTLMDRLQSVNMNTHSRQFASRDRTVQ